MSEEFIVNAPEMVAVGMWAKSPSADWPGDLIEITPENLGRYQSDYVWFLGCPNEGDWCPEGFEFFDSYLEATASLDDGSAGVVSTP